MKRLGFHRSLPMLLLVACGAGPGPVVGPLPACPPTPNCVSSEGGVDAAHAIAPLPSASAEELAAALGAIGGCTMESVAGDAIHATCRTAVFRLVDDVHLRINREAGVTHVRSASRLGRGDLGVNRRRVEALRAALPQQ